MMQFMAGNNVGDGADGHFILVGDAPAGPGSFIEPAKQR